MNLVKSQSLSEPSLEILQTFERDGVTYDYYARRCDCCENLLYFIGRTDGARVSCFQSSENKAANPELVVDELHESFAIDVSIILGSLKRTIENTTVTAAGFKGFDSHGLSNFRMRALDRARLILNRFSSEGKLDYLEEHADLIDDDLVASFYSRLFGKRVLVDYQL